ncbi:YwqH-like family protein [Cytobacillus purgationiresistens]|uniref:Uncharacterized protein (UPF0335 family) n=1 Tax=Cytobacillus purgationiresistens TaxID=863449 RepID=A0ABU0AN65_9BACI|nr:DUF5082 family protein [Cytobacillus purgationiresistens]MDQ0272728.1 uncharacterized protein (UPF0335 family) [Cytobacillus purgationiresistens]
MQENQLLIASLKSDRIALQNNIQANLEKIQRLRQSKNNITHEQGELWAHKRLISEPELSSSTWDGKHAAEFMNIRANIEQSYTSINSQQVEDIFSDIEQKIAQLESMNNGYSNSIASINLRISQL